MEGVGRGSRGEWERWEQWEEGGGTAFKFLEHGYLKTPSGSSNQLVRLQKVMGWCTAQCKMLLFCLKIIIKESPSFELKKKVKKKERKKEKHFGSLMTFWFSFFVMLFCATRRVVGHEAHENEWYYVTKAYNFTCFEGFFVLSYIACPRYPYI